MKHIYKKIGPLPFIILLLVIVALLHDLLNYPKKLYKIDLKYEVTYFNGDKDIVGYKAQVYDKNEEVSVDFGDNDSDCLIIYTIDSPVETLACGVRSYKLISRNEIVVK